ncbi:MAG: glycosyltransferase family 4 protein [Patescibacteria group bacterium]|jgi:glycosyltransferase involved in cell wall biosynthesis
MKRLRIAQLVPFEETVPPTKYGGTELVAANLCDGLVKMGHDVTLYSVGGSHTKAKLVKIFPQSLRAATGTDLKARESLKFMGVGKVLNYVMKGKFDVIHNHIGWRLLPFLDIMPAPVVTTLHGPLDISYQQFVYGHYKTAPYVSISNNQRKPMKLNFTATVYNGIRVDKFTYKDKKQDYLAFLGRMSPEKGPVQAIQVAKKTKKKLIMAAKVDAVDVKFFNEKVKPLIDGKQIIFLGEVAHEGKNKLLSNAAGLLALIQWEEPFGLFMAEANACGTPVIAMARGAAPEVIADKKTGYLVHSTEEAARMVSKLGMIKPKDCRARAQARFSVEAMVNGYLKVYQKLIKEFKPHKNTW